MRITAENISKIPFVQMGKFHDIDKIKEYVVNKFETVGGKILGGLWAAPLSIDVQNKTLSDWHQWTKDENFQFLNEGNIFRLKESAKILCITNKDEYLAAIEKYPKEKKLFDFEDAKCEIDYEALCKAGYDGLYISPEAIRAFRNASCGVKMDSGKLAVDTNAWDVQSLVLFNGDCIDIDSFTPFTTKEVFEELGYGEKPPVTIDDLIRASSETQLENNGYKKCDEQGFDR